MIYLKREWPSIIKLKIFLRLLQTSQLSEKKIRKKEMKILWEEEEPHKNLMKFVLFISHHGRRCQGNEGNKFMKFTTDQMVDDATAAVAEWGWGGILVFSFEHKNYKSNFLIFISLYRIVIY